MALKMLDKTSARAAARFLHGAARPLAVRGRFARRAEDRAAPL